MRKRVYVCELKVRKMKVKELKLGDLRMRRGRGEVGWRKKGVGGLPYEIYLKFGVEGIGELVVIESIEQIYEA